ncbi:hypothetical protein [Methanofollis sp. UBA420]|uniref:hypothetical protein n=1 Tax=Methanofollis sp. UBA420 TaxID=1915514 RepID=UPI003BEF38F7
MTGIQRGISNLEISLVLWRLQGAPHRLNLISQFRELPGDDEPDRLRVNTEVMVNDNIPEADNFSPGNLGILLPESVRYIAAGLTDHLKIPDHRIKGLSISGELLFRETADIFFNGTDAFQNIVEKEGDFTLRHRRGPGKWISSDFCAG